MKNYSKCIVGNGYFDSCQTRQSPTQTTPGAERPVDILRISRKTTDICQRSILKIHFPIFAVLFDTRPGIVRCYFPNNVRFSPEWFAFDISYLKFLGEDHPFLVPVSYCINDIFFNLANVAPGLNSIPVSIPAPWCTPRDR